MDKNEAVLKFLKTRLYQVNEGKAKEREILRYPFVSLSRQTGAGGHTLGSAILNEMKAHPGKPLFKDWHLFDREIADRVAKDPDIRVSAKELEEEKYRSEIEDYLEEVFLNKTPQDAVLKKIFECLRSLAKAGKVILLGRAAVCLTRDLPSGIHIRLVASEPRRVSNMQKLLGVDEKYARQMIKEQDESRRRLVRVYFDRDIDDPLLYDAVWNTDYVPIDEIARLLLKMIEEKYKKTGRVLQGEAL